MSLRKLPIMVMACILLSTRLTRAQAQKPEWYVEEKTIATADGDINAGVEQYMNPVKLQMTKTLVALRIPFAEPPVESLRFKPPQAHSSWSSPLNTNRMKGLALNLCPQVDELYGITPQSRHKGAVQDPVEVFWSEYIGGKSFIPQNISENCLHLNVWAPLENNGSIKDSLAVMVFIHGGGFSVGSANLNLHEGTALSMGTENIVVTLNYRLGALGFFHANGVDQSTANLGLMDQTMALKWVQTNIRSFGGDPNRVTVFGESAGSASVHFLMMSPMSQGLFQKAILQSGVASNSWAHMPSENVAKSSVVLARSLGCLNDNDTVNNMVLECLRTLPAMTIMFAANKLEKQGLYFIPTTDNVFFPTYVDVMVENFTANPSQSHQILMGFNRNEGSQFLLFSKLFSAGVSQYDYLSEMMFDGFVKGMIPEANNQFVMNRVRQQYHRKTVRGLIQLLTDSIFRCDIVKTASKMSMNGGKVSLYLFDEDLDFAQKAYPYYGASHALELQPLFGRPFIAPNLYSDSERALAYFMMKYWGDFAKGLSDSIQLVAPKEALVISGRPSNPEVETIDMTKCEFLACLPDLVKIGRGETPADMNCFRWTQSGVGESKALVSVLVGALLVVSSIL